MTERKKMKLRITLFLMAGFFIFLAFFSILKNPSSPQEGLVVWDYLFYACMLIASILMFLEIRWKNFQQVFQLTYGIHLYYLYAIYWHINYLGSGYLGLEILFLQDIGRLFRLRESMYFYLHSG